MVQEVGKDQLSEGTIGHNIAYNGRLIKKVFDSPSYICSLVSDVAGAEMAGNLKNVVALGAGFVDGLKGGANAKVAFIHPFEFKSRWASKNGIC
jgi:glycerol-3-phosphate dehydrogenase (NAD+)